LDADQAQGVRPTSPDELVVLPEPSLSQRPLVQTCSPRARLARFSGVAETVLARFGGACASRLIVNGSTPVLPCIVEHNATIRQSADALPAN
jgi:hypothetical protein